MIATSEPMHLIARRKCQPMDIEANLSVYLAKRDSTARYASFDYCFNHFQTYREQDRTADLASTGNMELSCLQLGFYLASWGMLRGSSVLLQRSVKHFVPVVEVIAESPSDVWEIDADRYSDDVCASLADIASRIRAALPDGASDVLVTKILLGVFGSVPAFDTNFRKGFGVTRFDGKALARVGAFYEQNAKAIEEHRPSTLDFGSAIATSRKYTRAKVIDMVFFVEGSKL